MEQTTRTRTRTRPALPELDGDWSDRARCRGVDPDQFFVRGAAQARRAIAVCGRCEVKDQCLKYALENGVEFGVWGGLTERQRRAYQRRLLADAS